MNNGISSNVSGVYLIQCIENGKKYIGSAKCIKGRWRTHIYDLNNKKHHSMKLQEDWIKYGQDKFEFKILKVCSHAESKKIEMEYIEKFNSDTLGYNCNDLKDSVKKRFDLINKQILEYATENGYRENGELYWFNIFDLSKAINKTVIDLLKHFGVNQLNSWSVSYKVDENNYIGLNWNECEGVHVIVYDESFLNM